MGYVSIMSMKKGSTNFLRSVIFIIGLFVLVLCAYVFPSVIISGKAGYFTPILLGLYVTAVPFFIALHQSLKLLGFIDKNTAFSESAVKALGKIKYCGISISLMFAMGMPYIFYAMDLDDAPGGILIALVIIFASAVIAVFAAVLQKLLKNVIDIKSENELTV